MRSDRRYVVALFVVALLPLVNLSAIAIALARDATPVTVTLDLNDKGPAIPPAFSGLSYETALLLAGEKGERYFRPDNAALVAMFKTLNVRSLRIGGNTADRATVPMPSEADIDSLFQFARAADVKVVYTLRLKENPEPAVAAGVAKYIWDRYRDNVLCFAIGNEPTMYLPDAETYCEQLRTYMAAIDAPGVALGATFAGPAATPNKTAWCRTVAERLGGDGSRLKLITQHSYPGGDAKKVADPRAGRAAMLSEKWVANYQRFYDGFVPVVKRQKLGYRLEECNSFYSGGREEVSNSFAAALWTLDFMYWWAAHGCDGVNLHTVDKPNPTAERKPGHYTPISSTADGYRAHPVAYGIKAFGLGGSRGTFVTAKVKADDALNLTAYAVKGEDDHHGAAIYLTLINKTIDANARDATVTVRLDAAPTGVRAMSLLAPGADPSAKDGATLGGGIIDERGRFTGKWSDRPSATDPLTFAVPAASALVVRFHMR
jgi:hypothetical protein